MLQIIAFVVPRSLIWLCCMPVCIFIFRAIVWKSALLWELVVHGLNLPFTQWFSLLIHAYVQIYTTIDRRTICTRVFPVHCYEGERRSTCSAAVLCSSCL